MKFINRIEIKYFRSFSENPTKIYHLKDINIFSWWNDSWKSNILRSLNLFFNEKIDHRTEFDFDRDFCVFQDDKIDQRYLEKQEETSDARIRKWSPFVEIKIHFILDKAEKKSLPHKFWISKRRTTTKLADISSNIETEYAKEHKKEKRELASSGNKQVWINKLNSLKRTQTLFLKKITFFYVPAIKDTFFFWDLYNALQDQLADDANKKLETAVWDLQTQIQEQTWDLFDKFKDSTWLDASFLLEWKILDFKKNIEVVTKEKYGKIFFKSRWDGIQARLIPDILSELSSKSKSKYVIWWFEEPENSYEYKNSLKLAKEFYEKYSEYVQLFITTHAKEFLAMQDRKWLLESEKKISIYRIAKSETWSSSVFFYNEDKWLFINEKKLIIWSIDWLYEDLGIIDQSRLIAEMEKKIQNFSFSKEEYNEAQKEINKLLISIESEKKEKVDLNRQVEYYKTKNKKIIYCEGWNEAILNALWFNDVIFLWGQNKSWVFDSTKTKWLTLPFWIIDKDYLLVSECELIEDTTNTIVLDYYCIENYLYHPDNIAEWKEKNWVSYNKSKYIKKISVQKNSWWWWEINKYSVNSIREKYWSIMKHIKEITKLSIIDSPDSIDDDLNENDFESIYKHIPMKKWKSKFTELTNIQDIDLAKTERFKSIIVNKLKSLSLTPTELWPT